MVGEEEQQQQRRRRELGVSCRWRPSHRTQHRNYVSLQLFGLLSLLFVVTLEATTAVAAKAKVGSSGAAVGQIRPSNTSLRNIEDENVPLFVAESVQGTQARLPCNVTPPITGDKVILVIWYKDGLSTPIYSFDVRDAKFEKGSHWVDEQKFGGRAYFQAATRPSAALVVENTTNGDSGLYRCRVDFHKSPTRNARVQLRVIIPPEKVLMLDERGVHIPDYILGPYNEDSSINITCVSIGGSPLPTVTWMHENTILKSDFVVMSEKRVKNVLHLERLQRKHLHRVLTCHAANNNVTQPITSSVTLDMNLRPLWVRLQGENRPLSADNHYELQCQVVGSKPEPTVTWWKGSQPMRNTHQTTSAEGNVTTSILSFTPTIDDRGKYLSCRAEQSRIPDSGKEDGWKLDIYHIPVVSLEFGTNQNSSTGIREGADVYFECNIKSNPWIYRVSWRHNGKLLDNNPAEGVSVANQSLVLQNVSRMHAGIYTCVGSNREGDGESNPVQLDINFAPVCRPGQRYVYSAGRGEAVKVICELEANPSTVNFTWSFNGTNAENIDIPTSDIYTEHTKSMARYTPNSENDYGMLLCWGSNELGKQVEPCVFNILPAGRPDPVTNCSVVNMTFDMVFIDCAEGFNGGLVQAFRADVFTNNIRNHVQTVESRTPSFHIKHLQSEAHYGILLFAYNEKGESEGTRMPIYTLKNPEKQTDFIPMALLSMEHLKPFLPIILGATGGFLLIALLIIAVVKSARGSREEGRDLNPVNSRSSNQLSPAASSDESMEKNPDIIPHGNKNGGPRQFQWINANVYSLCPSDGTREGVTAESDIRTTYDRMQFSNIANGIPENAAVYSQFVQQQQQQGQGQGITSTVSSPSYMSAIPATLVPLNSVNYTTANTTTTSFANLGGGFVPVQKMPYTTATLGRPPRHPGLKGVSEPSICAQIDLARHHPHPSLNNTRIAVPGQSQLSTFPRAPPVLLDGTE